MRKNFISVLPKDKCLAISKIVNAEKVGEWDDDDFLSYLPDHIFGGQMVYTNLQDDFAVFDGQYEWHIPTYFIEYAPVLII